MGNDDADLRLQIVLITWVYAYNHEADMLIKADFDC